VDAREWLKAQAAGGWVAYDPASGRFTLPDEVAAALVHGPGGAIVDACVTMMLAMGKDFPLYEEAFRTGRGVAWQEKSPEYLDGANALTRVAVGPVQVAAFLAGLDGVAARLGEGGRVADVGCGYGSPTIALAQAYEHAQVWGFDAHDGSIARARKAAAAAGVADRVRFEVASAKDLPVPDGGYDLVTFFDVVHDLGDPVGALARARDALAEGSAVMLVEPLGADRVEDNLNPIGRMWYGASVIACTPNALAHARRADRHAARRADRPARAGRRRARRGARPAARPRAGLPRPRAAPLLGGGQPGQGAGSRRGGGRPGPRARRSRHPRLLPAGPARRPLAAGHRPRPPAAGGGDAHPWPAPPATASCSPRRGCCAPPP